MMYTPGIKAEDLLIALDLKDLMLALVQLVHQVRQNQVLY